MTHVLQRVPLWLWGVCLCVLSNCLTALGLVTQKMAHIQNEQSGKKANYLKQPWFIAGRDHGMTHQKLDKEVVRLFEFYKVTRLGGFGELLAYFFCFGVAVHPETEKLHETLKFHPPVDQRGWLRVQWILRFFSPFHEEPPSGSKVRRKTHACNHHKLFEQNHYET